ncbi:Hypothetical predicted protein, partial [Pelobates cultripes]
GCSPGWADCTERRQYGTSFSHHHLRWLDHEARLTTQTTQEAQTQPPATHTHTSP